MIKKHPTFLSFIMLLVASLACSQSGAPAPPQDPNAMNTSIAQSIAQRQTEAAALFTPTITSIPGTATSTPAETPSPTLEITATLEDPMLSVSADTNCRVGPGAIYERVGVLLVGEITEVLGRDFKGEYWYVRNPDEGAEACWVWGEYATVTGNMLSVPFMTPLPPPIASFTIAFNKIQNCSVRWLDLSITNTSTVVFESISLVIKDSSTTPETVLTQKSNDFTHSKGCDSPIDTDTLLSGATVTVSSPFFSYDPKGHNINAQATLCSEPDQKGLCATQEITFQP